MAETLLDRYGVVTRGSVVAERVPGGFAAAYRVLSAFEETGRARRGYFVEGLGAAQFSQTGAVDRLRAIASAAERDTGAAPHPGASGDGLDRRQSAAPLPPRHFLSQPAPSRPAGSGAVVLAATDPASPYGGALPWPSREGDGAAGHRPGRKAGALVVLVDGMLTVYVERGGKSLLTYTEDPEALQPGIDALALAVREGALGRITVERADGVGVLSADGMDSPLAQALERGGFHATPRGLRLRR